MTPETRSRLDDLIGGKADGLVQHANAFVTFWNGLENQDQTEAMHDLLTRFKREEFKNEAPIQGENIERPRLEELGGKVGMMIDATLNYIISNRLAPQDAAVEVQRLLDGRQEVDEKVFCLAGIMSSHVVPYAVVPELKVKMSNEAYQEHVKAVTDGISKIRIASGVSRNAAEMADLVLSVVEEETEWEKKVALLSYFIVLRERTVASGRMQEERAAQQG